MSHEQPSLDDLLSTISRVEPVLDTTTDARIKARLDARMDAHDARSRRRALWIGGALAAAILLIAVLLVRTRSPREAGVEEAPWASPALALEMQKLRLLDDELRRAFVAGDLEGSSRLAEQSLRAMLESGTDEERRAIVTALELTRHPEGAPLLYQALRQDSLELRLAAAHALAELGLPESVAKVRAALNQSGESLKVDLAAVLYRLGDRDAGAILQRALSDDSTGLLAAAAMAEEGDTSGLALLRNTLRTSLPSRSSWWKAAAALAALRDPQVEKLLRSELSQPEPKRVVTAAAILARAGEQEARTLLARLVEDRDFSRRGDAALVLARLGDARAVKWVATGLSSADATERQQALAICGTFPFAHSHTETIADLLARDPDRQVRLTAMAAMLGATNEPQTHYVATIPAVAAPGPATVLQVTDVQRLKDLKDADEALYEARLALSRKDPEMAGAELRIASQMLRDEQKAALLYFLFAQCDDQRANAEENDSHRRALLQSALKKFQRSLSSSGATPRDVQDAMRAVQRIEQELLELQEQQKPPSLIPVC